MYLATLLQHDEDLDREVSTIVREVSTIVPGDWFVLAIASCGSMICCQGWVDIEVMPPCPFQWVLMEGKGSNMFAEGSGLGLA